MSVQPIGEIAAPAPPPNRPQRVVRWSWGAMVGAAIPTSAVLHAQSMSGGDTSNTLFILEYGSPVSVLLGLTYRLLPPLLLAFGVYLLDSQLRNAAHSTDETQLGIWISRIAATATLLAGMFFSNTTVYALALLLTLLFGTSKRSEVKQWRLRKALTPLAAFVRSAWNPLGIGASTLLIALTPSPWVTPEHVLLTSGKLITAQVIGTSGNELAILTGHPLRTGFLSDSLVRSRQPCTTDTPPGFWDWSFSRALSANALGKPAAC